MQFRNIFCELVAESTPKLRKVVQSVTVTVTQLGSGFGAGGAIGGSGAVGGSGVVGGSGIVGGSGVVGGSAQLG